MNIAWNILDTLVSHSNLFESLPLFRKYIQEDLKLNDSTMDDIFDMRKICDLLKPKTQWVYKGKVMYEKEEGKGGKGGKGKKEYIKCEIVLGVLLEDEYEKIKKIKLKENNYVIRFSEDLSDKGIKRMKRVGEEISGVWYVKTTKVEKNYEKAVEKTIEKSKQREIKIDIAYNIVCALNNSSFPLYLKNFANVVSKDLDIPETYVSFDFICLYLNPHQNIPYYKGRKIELEKLTQVTDVKVSEPTQVVTVVTDVKVSEPTQIVTDVKVSEPTQVVTDVVQVTQPVEDSLNLDTYDPEHYKQELFWEEKEKLANDSHILSDKLNTVLSHYGITGVYSISPSLSHAEFYQLDNFVYKKAICKWGGIFNEKTNSIILGKNKIEEIYNNIIEQYNKNRKNRKKGKNEEVVYEYADVDSENPEEGEDQEEDD